jgi:subtilase family serine protease
MPEFAVSSSSSGVTNVHRDLARYDSIFHLPPVDLQILTRFAGAGAPSLASGEEAGDIEIAHAVAPKAAIRVVLTPALGNGSYIRALQYAIGQGAVISITAGLGESCVPSAGVASLHSVFRTARDRHVTVVVSSGDSGAASPWCGTSTYTPTKGVSYPASDPLVLSVGGTSLQSNHVSGAYIGETAWNMPVPGAPGPYPGLYSASGGGFSSLFARPAYQDRVPGIGADRGVPDVAADAAPDTGLAVVSASGNSYAIFPGAGTSAGAPFWAGFMAIADQFAGHQLGFVNAGIYRVARSPQYEHAFHDVTSGNNTVVFPQEAIVGYQASRGWDPVTGWGSPNTGALVPLLVKDVHGDDGEGL